MGLTWQNDLRSMIVAIENLPKQLEDAVEPLVAEAAREGADIMYQNIDRIDTEFMKGSVGNSDAKQEGNTIYAEWGWGIDGAQVEPYFLYQEYGFTHAVSNKDIPPMHALTESFIRVWEKFKGKIARMTG